MSVRRICISVYLCWDHSAYCDGKST